MGKSIHLEVIDMAYVRDSQRAGPLVWDFVRLCLGGGASICEPAEPARRMGRRKSELTFLRPILLAGSQAKMLAKPQRNQTTRRLLENSYTILLLLLLVWLVFPR